MNAEQQIDIQNRSVIRYYKMKVNELLREKEAILNEAASLKGMLNSFKAGSEIAERKIKHLEGRVTIAEEQVLI